MGFHVTSTSTLPSLLKSQHRSTAATTTTHSHLDIHPRPTLSPPVLVSIVQMVVTETSLDLEQYISSYEGSNIPHALVLATLLSLLTPRPQPLPPRLPVFVCAIHAHALTIPCDTIPHFRAQPSATLDVHSEQVPKSAS